MSASLSLSDALKTASLILSLGLDTFAVSVGLGISGLPRRQQLRYGVTFAFAEGVMPLAGFFLGKVLATAIGARTDYLAAALLLAVGVYTIWEARAGEEHHYADGSLLKLLAAAFSVSLDELAIGFSLGLLHVPVLLAAALIAAQAFVLTLAGTTLGRAIGQEFSERAELLSGLILALLALFLFGEQLFGR